ncbi:epoxide hydrolase family protein [Phytohabitans flavus]|uniref:epoxide hydrolase family protein n=1 Tax=Phytohabitans flavus TaxID=1076124 RepID=UPI0036336151
MTPFRIDVPDRDLDDLRDRLARTRWPVQLPGDDWSRGVPVEHLRELADYWRGGFDWRAREAELNAFPQFTTSIDGLDVHFLHARSARPDALPLLLTHGWPATFVEFVRLIPLLTGAFHVVVPSVPGFGWSQAPVEAGFSVGRVARMWAELMARLGYDRYGTQGGDLGAYVAPEVAVVDPEHVVGVHIDGGLGFPSESDVAQMSAAERAEFEEMMQWAAPASTITRCCGRRRRRSRTGGRTRRPPHWPGWRRSSATSATWSTATCSSPTPACTGSPAPSAPRRGRCTTRSGRPGRSGRRRCPAACTPAARPSSAASPSGTTRSCTGRKATRAATSWRWRSRRHTRRTSRRSSPRCPSWVA